jgi:hypothetical protein
MSETNLSASSAPKAESTPSEKPVIEQKPNDSVSLLNEEPDPKTEETKPATETKPTEGEKPKDGDKPAGAPEKYEAFKLPEGLELSEEINAEATAVFKELGLTQAAAQKLVDFHSKTLQATVEAAAKAPIDSWMEQKKTWKTEIKADPEIGGKLGEVKARIGAMYAALGDTKLVTEFKAAMDLTGAGDNPAFIRLFHKLAERLGEGKPVTGDTPKPKPSSAAQAMYPNLPSAG